MPELERNRRLLARYRAEVERLMALQSDMELTLLHMGRSETHAEQKSITEVLARMLLWRLRPLRAIEPDYYDLIAHRLAGESERLDAINAQHAAAKTKAAKEKR
jgi:hypothetical protein